jgi:hypothetical protein
MALRRFRHFLHKFMKRFTVKKAERDAGPKHEGDGKFHHPGRMIGKIRQHQRLGLSIYMGATLGVSNSV